MNESDFMSEFPQQILSDSLEPYLNFNDIFYEEIVQNRELVSSSLPSQVEEEEVSKQPSENNQGSDSEVHTSSQNNNDGIISTITPTVPERELLPNNTQENKKKEDIVPNKLIENKTNIVLGNKKLCKLFFRKQGNAFKIKKLEKDPKPNPNLAKNGNLKNVVLTEVNKEHLKVLNTTCEENSLTLKRKNTEKNLESPPLTKIYKPEWVSPNMFDTSKLWCTICKVEMHAFEEEVKNHANNSLHLKNEKLISEKSKAISSSDEITIQSPKKLKTDKQIETDNEISIISSNTLDNNDKNLSSILVEIRKLSKGIQTVASCLKLMNDNHSSFKNSCIELLKMISKNQDTLSQISAMTSLSFNKLLGIQESIINKAEINKNALLSLTRNESSLTTLLTYIQEDYITKKRYDSKSYLMNYNEENMNEHSYPEDEKDEKF